MKIGIVGTSYQERSLPFDAQRLVNFYPVFDQTGKEVAALYGTPGLALFATAGTGPIRGAFVATNERAFVVSSGALYEVFSDGTSTSRGSLLTTTGNVTIDENGTQLMICDGTYGYIFTYATDAFAQISDGDFPSAGTMTFIDGYFVVNKNNSGAFYISDLNNGTAWDALDFATAESSPDNLVRVINAVGQLWLFGTKTTEIWQNTGGSLFPFQRISGAAMGMGCYAAHTVIAIDNSVFWVGKDANGALIVFRAQGFTPSRISTNSIEYYLQSSDLDSTLRAYTYQQDGHVFYVLTGGGLPTTLVYDISTQMWHERAFLNTLGEYEQHLGCCGMYAFGKFLVGSRLNGKIYEMSLDIYDDDGFPLAADRVYTHISQEDQRIRYSQLVIGCETGVGNQSDPAQEPLISMRLSKDGARTWSNWYTTSMGKVGEYLGRVVFRRLGIAKMLTFHIRITDPVKRAITGSYLS